MIKYPIYVISKGRADLTAHTARFLQRDQVSFKLVIESQEQEDYEKRFGKENILILPFSNLGQGSIPARNWVWEHSKSQGHKRHWILDDNIDGMVKRIGKKRIKCNSQQGFESVEAFVDQFSNIAIAGINYRFFGIYNKKSFYLNSRAYSCMLIFNDLSFRWRGRYNEDTDLCLQALTNNYCTVNINAYSINKAATMTCKGGNMTELYQGNGRLKMARSLELQWAKYHGLVKTTWKWNRPQHQVNWKMFKTQLKRNGTY